MVVGTRPTRPTGAAPGIIFVNGGGAGDGDLEEAEALLKQQQIDKCIAKYDGYTAGLTGATLIAAGANIVSTRGKFVGATSGTSPASQFGRHLDSLTGNAARMPNNPYLNSVTLGGARRAATVGVFAGRAVPVVGLALTAGGVGIVVGCNVAAN